MVRVGESHLWAVRLQAGWSVVSPSGYAPWPLGENRLCATRRLLMASVGVRLPIVFAAGLRTGCTIRVGPDS